MAKFLSLVKANKNHVMNNISPFIKRFTAAPYSHLKPIPIMRFSSSSTCISPPDPNTNATCTKNPCFDLFFKSRVEIYNPTNAEACRQLIEKMLPVAWSHNPLTTLKLICRILLDKSNGKYYSDQTFHTVTFWLHQNHPKTLTCNVSSIAQLFVSFFQFFNLMGLCLVMKEENRFNGKGIHCRDNNARGQAEADVVEPDFGFSHEFVSDLFAECLKSDMEKLKHYSNVDDADTDHDEYMMMGITEAAACCLSIGSCFSDPNTMCKSIARKVFPRESYPEYQGVEEVDYVDRVLNRLRNEVLVPLSKACSSTSSTCSRGNSREFVVDKYFEEVKAENSKIAADALFPYEITAYAYECSFEQVAELQWKTLVANMMSRISNKQGNKIFNNCLPICDVNSLHILGRRSVEVSVALALLVSELNEEPWKGKVIDCSTVPNLHLVQGDGLRHKCDFVRRMDSEWSIDFVKVFDLILKEAVNAELKPEEMIKKVLVFTSTTDFDIISVDRMNFDDPSWKNEYEAVQRSFKEKGYGNAVPDIVLWNMSEWEQRKWVLPSTHPGVTVLDGFTNNLIKLLLDNGGGIRPDLVMEASIAGQEFQRMVVMD